MLKGGMRVGESGGTDRNDGSFGGERIRVLAPGMAIKESLSAT